MAKNRIGWECPKCGACYAPSVSRCWNCSGIIEAIGKPIIPPYTVTTWPSISVGVCGNDPDPQGPQTIYNGEMVS